MKLSEKVSLLAELGVTDLLESEDLHSNFEILIGGVARYIFDDKTVLDFMPSSILDDECLELHFAESEYDLGWVDLLSGSFKEMVEFEASNMVRVHFDQHLTQYSADFLEKYLVKWVDEWCSKCRQGYKRALAEIISPVD